MDISAVGAMVWRVFVAPPDPHVNYAFLQFLAMAAPFIGSLLSGGAKAKAANRGAQAEASIANDRNVNDRARINMEQEVVDRNERDNAWKTLQRLAYVKNQAGAPQSAPAYLDSKYYNANAVRRTSPDELAGAEGLEKELMARLQGGPRTTNLPPLGDVNKFGKAGLGEKLMGWGSAGLGAFGVLNGLRNGGSAVDDDPWRE
jgi:hypothetical protein